MATQTAHPRRLGSRISRIRATDSYRLVLGLIVVLFLFAALAPDDPWTASVAVLLQGAILAIAIVTSGLTDTYVHAASAVFAVSVVGAVAPLVNGGDATSAGVGLLSAVLAVATAAVVLVGVARQEEVNLQSVRGAISVYVLIGLTFIFVYVAVSDIESRPFFAQAGEETRSLFLYFSFVTLATLGYGDFTPATQAGRTLAVIEALLGQLYLVTVIALLVARLGRRRSKGS